MDHVRILSTPGDSSPTDPLNSHYLTVVSRIDEWFSHFFEASVENLLVKVQQFLSDHSGSPFPVIVHVLPPQEGGDCRPFEEALAGLGVPVVKHQVFHIQQDCFILFHHSAPPSDIPRVLGFFYCLDPLPLFFQFVNGILSILFSFGLTPGDGFIGEFRSLYFDKFRSFSFLVNLVRQSLLIHFQAHAGFDFSEVFECAMGDYMRSFLTKSVHTRDLPTAAVVKLRGPLLSVLEILATKFETQQPVLDVLRFEEIVGCRTFRALVGQMGEVGDQTLRDYIVVKQPLLKGLFESEAPREAGLSQKTRRGRAAALVGQATVQEGAAVMFERAFAKAFLAVPPGSPCGIDLCDTASFDPRRAMLAVLSDEETECDTPTAFQIITEQPGRAVELADLLEAFAAKMGIDSQAVALSRIEVAVSELEYLGFVDRKTRKKDGLRKILRV